MTGATKFPVQVRGSMLMVELCANGCPPDDLYVVIQDARPDWYQPPQVCVGCIFCGQKVHRAKVESALEAWSARRRIRDINERLGRLRTPPEHPSP